MTTPVLSGPFTDVRPWFAVAVTGHAGAIANGLWTASVLGRASFEQVGALVVRGYLDGVLYRKRETHRVTVYCRDEDTGIDHLVRAYCESRRISCLPALSSRDVWGDAAGFRRDIEMLARCAALVWFGPREPGPDPVTLAACLGIEYRVVDLARVEEGE